MVRGTFEFSELDQVIRKEELGVVVIGIGAQREFQVAPRSGVVTQFIERNAQQRGSRRHLRINLQPFLQHRSRLLVFPLPEIERPEVVVGRGETRRNLQQRFIMCGGASKVAARFRSFRVDVEFLHPLIASSSF